MGGAAAPAQAGAEAGCDSLDSIAINVAQPGGERGDGVPGQLQAGTGAFAGWIRGRTIEKREDADGLAGSFQLARHFVSHDAAEAVAAEPVRSGRLDGAHFLNVARSHGFDAVERLGRGDEAVGGLVWSKFFGQFAIGEKTAATAAAKGVQPENRGFRAGGLNLDEAGAKGGAFFLGENGGHFLDGRSLKENRERQVFAQDFFDLGDQLDREERVAADLEEVVRRAKGTVAEDIFPDVEEFSLEEGWWQRRAGGPQSRA